MQRYMESMTLISQEIDNLLDALANVAANNDDGKKIYNVQGDLVMQKHVEYEVNEVASGGVGVKSEPVIKNELSNFLWTRNF